MNKGWTKNSINRLLVKFRTVDRRLGSGRRSVHADENVDTVEFLLLSQEDKPQSQEKFHVRWGDPLIISFADYSQSSASKCYKKRRAQQLAEAHSMHTFLRQSVDCLKIGHNTTLINRCRLQIGNLNVIVYNSNAINKLTEALYSQSEFN